MADLNYLRTVLANGGADLPTLNAIRALLDSGQVTDQDLSQMHMSGSMGGDSPPQNAMAQALDAGDQPSRTQAQMATAVMAQGDQPGRAMERAARPPAQAQPPNDTSAFGIQDQSRIANRDGGPQFGDLDHELAPYSDRPLTPAEKLMRDSLAAKQGDPEAMQRIQNAIKQGIKPDQYGELPQGNNFVKNETTGLVTYLTPNGLSDAPNGAPLPGYARTGSNSPNGQPSMMKVVGAGGGTRVNLPDEAAPAQVNLDYSRPALEIGGAKAIYSKDEPGVAYVMRDGVPISKVLLGYDMQGSMQLNKANQDMAKGAADIVHTNAETDATRERIRASQVQNPDMGSMNGPTLGGDALLQSLDPGTAGLVKAYAEGRMAFPGGAAMRSPRMMQLLSLVSAYDPNFDAKDFNTRNKAQVAFTSGKQGDAVRAADQAIAHAGALSDDIEKLNNFNGLATPLNSVVNPIESAFGDPRQGRFKQNALALSAELRKVFAGGGGGSLAELQSWESGLPVNASQDQQRQYLAKGMDLLQGGINALNDQYQRAMGPRANIRDLLSPTAQAALAKMETGGQGQSASQSQPAASMANALPLPTDKSRLVAGQTYRTARGPARWNGSAFEG